MDVVTVLSGSGPAYFFILVQVLAGGGLRGGLTRDIAIQSGAQINKGAATMIHGTGLHLAVLKDGDDHRYRRSFRWEWVSSISN